jgi:hypothetical protein
VQCAKALQVARSGSEKVSWTSQKTTILAREMIDGEDIRFGRQQQQELLICIYVCFGLLMFILLLKPIKLEMWLFLNFHCWQIVLFFIIICSVFVLQHI